MPSKGVWRIICGFQIWQVFGVNIVCGLGGSAARVLRRSSMRVNCARVSVQDDVRYKSEDVSEW